MPLVEVEELAAAPVERVWELLNDVEAHARLMDHVRSVEVLERGPDHRLTAWEVDVKGCAMRWVEHEAIDPARHRVDYYQVKGDMAVFEGHWQVEALSDHTSKVTFSVRFDLGLPMLSPMIDPVAERAIQENARQMVAALGAAQAANDAGSARRAS